MEDTVDMDNISTSLIEQENLSFRQDNRRLSRKAIGFSKYSEMLNHKAAFYRVYTSFVKRRSSLIKQINEKVVGGVRRKWKHRTRAMYSSITDHVWSPRELLAFKVVFVLTK